MGLTESLLRLGCYPPPGRKSEDLAAARNARDGADPFRRLRRVFGGAFEVAIAGKTMVDLGCGDGLQSVAAAEAGAAKVIGVDIKPKFALGTERARERNLDVRFVLGSMRQIGRSTVDVVLSQNSFEHFSDPGAILADALHVLRPGGQFWITFGPPWKHPYGVHHYFMIRAPWLHLIFPERAVMELRKLYRDDAPSSYAECSLNQMTIAKFQQLIAESGFAIDRLHLTPISAVPRAIAQLLPEYTTSHVSAVLRKR